MTRRVPAVLVIAGSDSSGGAGLQRDLAVLEAEGVAHASAITAITAQTDSSVRAIHHVPPEVVREQIAVAFEGRDIRAVKIGMLGTKATVMAVAAGLRAHGDIPIVLDPVLVSSSGRALLDSAGFRSVGDLLFPMAALVTPNITEMASLCRLAVATNETELIGQARQVLAMGSKAVLAKGGHGEGDESVDVLVTRNAIVRLSSQRLNISMRGTGCALSTAVAVGLARGMPLPEACRSAKERVWKLITERGRWLEGVLPAAIRRAE